MRWKYLGISSFVGNLLYRNTCTCIIVCQGSSREGRGSGNMHLIINVGFNR